MDSVNKEAPHNWQDEIPHDVLELWKCSTLGPACQEMQGERDVAAHDLPAWLMSLNRAFRAGGGGG
jgi:hypothetical protein